MESSSQEYWSELSFPPPGDLPDLGDKDLGFPFHIWSWRKRKCHSHLFHSGSEGYERYVPVDLVGTS